MRQTFESLIYTALYPQLFTLQTQKNMLKCTHQKQAQLVCISRNCQAPGLMCINQSCQCLKKHDNCSIVKLEKILNVLNENANKKINITLDNQKSFEAVRKKIYEMIEQLSTLRQKLDSQQMYFGMKQQEIAFMNFMIQSKNNKICGKMVSKIIKQFQLNANLMLESQQQILKDLQPKKAEFDCLCKYIEQKFIKKDINEGLFSDSKIIEQAEQSAKLGKWLSEDSNKTRLKSKLLFRASENNFSAEQFHKHCDGIKNTLVIVKTEFDKIIGGFTPKTWDHSNDWVNDQTGKSFIFSLTLRKKYKCVQPEKSIHCSQTHGPQFGFGADLYISDNAGENNDSYSSLPYSYKNHKNGIIKYTQKQKLKARCSFTGAKKGCHFKVKQYEVYQIEGIQEKGQVERN